MSTPIWMVAPVPLRSADGTCCTLSESAAPIAAAQPRRAARKPRLTGGSIGAHRRAGPYGDCPIRVLVNRLQKEHPA